jgi:uncharacterized RDD family membrane protein YckC
VPEASTRPTGAGLARRLLALVYEALLIGAVIFFAAYLFLALARQATSGWERSLFQCYLFAVGGAYFGWFWSQGRRTLAMKTWHLRLTLADGRECDWKHALARYFAAWIGPALGLGAYLAIGRWGALAGGFNFIWALLDRERLFLHDRLAGTRLLRSS